MSNRQLEEIQEQEMHNEIASLLGISYEELMELDPNIEFDSDAYSILISFQQCPSDIRSKIEISHAIKSDPDPSFSVLLYAPAFFVS